MFLFIRLWHFADALIQSNLQFDHFTQVGESSIRTKEVSAPFLRLEHILGDDPSCQSVKLHDHILVILTSQHFACRFYSII